MTATADTTTRRRRIQASPFTSVVAGIDGSPEAVEAARQATVLATPGAHIELVAAFNVAAPIIGVTGMAVPLYFDEDSAREAAERAAAAAVRTVGRADAVRTVAAGPAWDVLLEAAHDPGTLLAVGSHGVGRLRGIVLGSTATAVVHKATAPVLVARAAGPSFPTRIVVGVDGSPESAAAFAVARELAERHGAGLWPVIVHGGRRIDVTAARAILGGDHEETTGDPATALVAAAAEGDLLVVGSRGLHGVKALGSTSERVAHEARCSVLVVRSMAT
jgi:nucleotide-binding universal stress UspA family protein